MRIYIAILAAVLTGLFITPSSWAQTAMGKSPKDRILGSLFDPAANENAQTNADAVMKGVNASRQPVTNIDWSLDPNQGGGSGGSSNAVAAAVTDGVFAATATTNAGSITLHFTGPTLITNVIGTNTPIGTFYTSAHQVIVGTNASGFATTNAASLTFGTLPPGRLPALTGDITTSAGSAATTLATVMGSPGTYRSLTVNGKGLATAGSNPTTFSGYAISDTWPNLVSVLTGSLNGSVLGAGTVADAALASTFLKANQTITASGDATGSGTTAITLTLKNTGTAGTYRSTTFDAQGRETSGTNPTTVSGYGLSDTWANLAAALTGTVPPASLPIASGSTLGAIKVGSGLSIDGSGVLSAPGGGSSGTTNNFVIVFNGVTNSWSAGLPYITNTIDGTNFVFNFIYDTNGNFLNAQFLGPTFSSTPSLPVIFTVATPLGTWTNQMVGGTNGAGVLTETNLASGPGGIGNTNVLYGDGTSWRGNAETNAVGFVGPGGGLTGLNGTAIDHGTVADARLSANTQFVIANAVTNGQAISPNVIYYVAPWGNDSSSGLSQYVPLATVYQASTIATNFGNLIYQMAGTNANELANPRKIRLTNGVSFYADAGAVLYLTNFSGGVSGGADFRPGPNSIIDGLNIIYLDAGSGIAAPFGYCGKSTFADTNSPSITNCLVRHLHIKSPTQAIHIEGNQLGQSIDIIFESPEVLAGGNAYQQKTLTTGNVNIVVNNPTFTVTNWTMGAQNNKPLRALALGASGRLTVNGGTITYSDNTVTNQAAYGVYYEGAADGTAFNGTVFDSSNGTNNSASADFNTFPNPPTLTSISKSDGSVPTYYDGANRTNAFNTGTNTSLYFSGNAAGTTNSGAIYSIVPTNSTSVSYYTNPANGFVTAYMPTNSADASTLKQSSIWATAGALPSNSYNNGTSGSGATLTGISLGALTVDGGSVAAGQRVLVKNEGSGANNGIYTVTATGSAGAVYVLTRATDFDQAAKIAEGDSTLVERGASNTNTIWSLTTSGTVTVGTTVLNFGQVNGGGGGTAIAAGIIPTNNVQGIYTNIGGIRMGDWLANTNGTSLVLTDLVSGAVASIASNGTVTAPQFSGNGSLLTGLVQVSGSVTNSIGTFDFDALYRNATWKMRGTNGQVGSSSWTALTPNVNMTNVAQEFAPCLDLDGHAVQETNSLGEVIIRFLVSGRWFGFCLYQGEFNGTNGIHLSPSPVIGEGGAGVSYPFGRSCLLKVGSVYYAYGTTNVSGHTEILCFTNAAITSNTWAYHHTAYAPPASPVVTMGNTAILSNDFDHRIYMFNDAGTNGGAGFWRIWVNVSDSPDHLFTNIMQNMLSLNMGSNNFAASGMMLYKANGYVVLEGHVSPQSGLPSHICRWFCYDNTYTNWIPDLVDPLESPYNYTVQGNPADQVADPEVFQMDLGTSGIYTYRVYEAEWNNLGGAAGGMAELHAKRYKGTLNAFSLPGVFVPVRGTTIYSTNLQTIANSTATLVRFQVATTNVLGSGVPFNGDDYSLVAFRSGLYHVSWAVKSDTALTDANSLTQLYKNGTYTGIQNIAGQGSFFNSLGAGDIYLKAGDILQLYFYQTTGGSVNAYGDGHNGSTSFSLTYLGDGEQQN